MIAEIVVLLLVVIVLHEVYWKTRNYPPGPWPLPFVGNLIPIVYYGLPDALQRFKKQYGDVVTLWFGPLPYVFLFNYEVMHEALIKDNDAFGARPLASQLQNEMMKGGDGIAIANGELWQQHKRFALRVLHEFGLGKNQMQERVLDEITFMISGLENEQKENNGIVDIQRAIDFAVGSVINVMTLGYRMTDQAQFDHVKKISDDYVTIYVHPITQVAQYIPDIARKLPYIRGFVHRQVETYNVMFEHFKKEIEKHEKDVRMDEEPRDYVEAFLQQKRRLEGTDENKNDHLFFKDQLINSLYDLWLAGQDTSANTLAWIMTYLVKNPDVQAKLHKELNLEIGSSRLVTVEDKPRLQYTQAVIHEGQRLGNIVPFNLPHRVTKNTQIRGYTIPADTIVIPQIRDSMYDQKAFPDHMKFNPDRYIDEKGDFVPSKQVIPFSLGKRSCLGEPLAKLELFLFTANILNRFRIEEVPDRPVDTTRVETTMTVRPQHFVVHLSPRYD